MRTLVYVCIFLAITVTDAWWWRPRRVCYPPYGCFSNAKPFNRPLVPFPQSPSKVGTRFLLYTRRSVNKYEVLSDTNQRVIERSSYDPRRTTRFVIHGFAGISSLRTILDEKNWWGMKMKNALLRKSNDNIIIVDWFRGAKFPYSRAVANTRLVGAQVAQLIQTLMAVARKKRIKLRPVHVIGVSLGAHISGYAGRRLRKLGKRLDRISGLDPAGPLFEGKHPDVRLDPSDAKFVDVIHTNNVFGIRHPVGHLDFYPNGGTSQKGCGIFDVQCSHMRAAKLFRYTINSPPRCPWRGYRCGSSRSFDRGYCLNCVHGCPSMGYNADKSRRLRSGKFYLYTSGSYPYCGFHYLITLYRSNSRWTFGLSPRFYVRLQGSAGSSGTIKLSKRKLKRRSRESFVDFSSRNIGTLRSVKLWHKRGNLWKFVEKVVVRPGWLRKGYTACKRWKPYKNYTQRKLVRGYRRC